jgi:ATP-dependent exoDNAse (exonuclease V) alpha subunit
MSPLLVSFAMTLNKSQGQTLTHVEVFLRNPVFSHGQLCVAICRVKTRVRLKLLISDENMKFSKKVKFNSLLSQICQKLENDTILCITYYNMSL